MRLASLVASCCVASLCSTAFSAESSGPYVAVRVDYFGGKLVPAVGAGPSKIGEQRGSGVIVAEVGPSAWFVLTNAHVVEVGEPIKRAEARVFVEGKWRKGRVIIADDERDLALLRIRSSTPLKATALAEKKPTDGSAVQTHGLIGGQAYCFRKTELRHALPLPGGARAWAPHRFYVRTTFRPGESGGAVTFEDRLVALIHGNDPAAGWGLIVDDASIHTFLEPYLPAATPHP